MLKSTKIGDKFSLLMGKLFCALPLKPNHYTLLSVLLAFAGMVMVIEQQVEIAILLFLLSFFLDAVDGAVARAKGMASSFGAFMDGVVDRVVETLFLISLAFMNIETMLFPSWLWVMVVLASGTYMTSFIKAYSHHRLVLEEREAANMPGLLERAERCVLLLLVMVLAYFNYGRVAGALLMVVALLATLTALQRCICVWRKAAGSKPSGLRNLKQVVVVRTDIKMGKGKLAAQVAHASLHAFLNADAEKRNAWLSSGQKKVVLKARSEEELMQLYKKARRKGLNAVMIRDAGLTQLEKGTITAMAAGPEEEEKLDEVFGELKLL